MIYSLYYEDYEGHQWGRNIIAETDKEAKKIANKTIQNKSYENICFYRMNSDGTSKKLKINSKKNK